MTDHQPRASDQPDLDLERALEVALDASRAAGALLVDGHRPGAAIPVRHKGEVDLVTEYDRRAEALVVDRLRAAFPDHAVIAEEGTQLDGARAAGGPLWLVDPIDGTTNYAHGHPWYAVSIGLEDGEGQPLLGVVHAPELGWTFHAIRGGGAWLGGRRLAVSTTADLDRSLVATGFPYDRRTARDNNVARFDAVLRRAQGMRRAGVASLDCAAVAWGILDGYWELKLKPWDLAGGLALVLEAGGRVTAPDGQPYRSRRDADGYVHVLATNGAIHDELRAVLVGAGEGAGDQPA